MIETDSKDKQESPWVILNCPSCEKKIKLPKDKVGAAKFKCPLCSVKIDVPVSSVGNGNAGNGNAGNGNAGNGNAGNGNVEKVVNTAESSDSSELIGQANLTLEDEGEENEEFLSRIKGADDRPKEEGEVVEKDGEQVVKRRRRVRKKKKTDTGPGWESEAGDEEAPNRDEDYSYVVDTEIDDEGNVVEVRRRVKADQKKTTYEKFSKNMSMVFVGFSVVTALLLVGAVIFLMKTGADPEGPKIGDVETRDTGEITSEITNEAFAVIQEYLTANTWNERVQLVRNATEVRPLMEAHYEKHPYDKREEASIIEQGDGQPASRREFIDRVEKADRVEAIFVAVKFPLGDYQFFALERKRVLGSVDKCEYLIDWEISERYRSVGDLEFKSAAVPGSTAEFRVSLQGQGTYFTPPFDSADEWRCYALTYPGDPDFQFFGYTKKGSEIDEKILALFTETGRPTPIIKVAYPKGKIVDRGAIEITELIQSTWFK